MSDQQQPRVKVSGMWANTTKDGKRYLSGSNGSVRYSIWENGFKQGESDPTHILFVEQVKKKEEASDTSVPF